MRVHSALQNLVQRLLRATLAKKKRKQPNGHALAGRTCRNPATLQSPFSYQITPWYRWERVLLWLLGAPGVLKTAAAGHDGRSLCCTRVPRDISFSRAPFDRSCAGLVRLG